MYLFTSEIVAPPGYPETFLYADIAARGQVGQSDYPWEKLDALEIFKALKQ